MEHDRQEFESEEAVLLPDREVMSLISTDPASEGFGGLELPTAGDADGAGAYGTDAAGSASDTAATTGDASGGGEQTVSEEDRSEQMSRTDTASATS